MSPSLSDFPVPSLHPLLPLSLNPRVIFRDLGLLPKMSEERGGLDYWIQWQVFVCALITAAPAIAAAVVLSRSKDERLRPSDLWTPCWRKLHPVWLLVYRALVVLIMAFLLSQMVLLDGAFAFYFYTQWTFTLVIIYFAIGTVISAHGCWMHSKKHAAQDEDEANGFIKREFQENNHATLTYRTNHVKEMNEKRAGFWGYAMQVIYQTSAGATMLTDIVFWGLLVPFMSSDKFTVNGIMFCMHSLNAIFLLIDTILNSLPFPWFRMAYFVFWSCTYVIFQWVLHAFGFTWWPYPFLELSTPWSPLWYIAMALVHVPCYLFYWLVVKAKNSFFPKWFPHAYVRSY